MNVHVVAHYLKPVIYYRILYLPKHSSSPVCLVTILCYWYRHQVMFVIWGSSLPTGYPMTNGVRQGAIQCLYINDLSIRLCQTDIGDSSGGKLVNHMIYADDLCVISLSSSGLQSLLNIDLH